VAKHREIASGLSEVQSLALDFGKIERKSGKRIKL